MMFSIHMKNVLVAVPRDIAVTVDDVCKKADISPYACQEILVGLETLHLITKVTPAVKRSRWRQTTIGGYVAYVISHPKQPDLHTKFVPESGSGESKKEESESP